MIKNLNKRIYLALVVVLMLLSVACQKKVKHKWVEVGADTNPTKVAPGVHPERGTESDAVKVIVAPITYPLGRDEKGEQKYKKQMYELDTLTPESIDEALKSLGIIGEDSVFCDLVITESDQVADVGPGATNETKLTKKGIVRYVDLTSPMDNSDDYEGKYYAKDLKGLIDRQAIEHCITETFAENFQLVSCDFESVTQEEYDKVHKK